MSFGGLVLTNKGRDLQAKAQAGAQLNFTRIALGDGDLGANVIANLNALIHQTKSCTIKKLAALTAGKATVGTSFSNQDIVTGFYWKELGVFAQDPDLGEILYCYGNAGATAEYIPPGGGPDIVEKVLDVVTLVGNATNITATIEQSLAFASQQDVGDVSTLATTSKTVVGAINEVNTGTRTVNQATGTAYANTGSLTQILSWIVKTLKDLKGTANWYDSAAATIQSIWGQFHASAGHKHTGGINDAPQIGTGGLADDAVTADKMGPGAADDVAVGNRTVDQGITSDFASTGTLTQLLSFFAKRLKEILGTNNWSDAIPASLTTLWNKFNSGTGHKHTGGTNDGPPIPPTGLIYPLMGANGVPATDGITYKSITSYNAPFVNGPSANTYYPVHNGGGSPVYLAVTFTLTRRSTVKITYHAAFKATSNFADIMYTRFNIKSGASVGGASVAAGYDLGKNYYNSTIPNPWEQISNTGFVQLDPGTYTVLVEWKTPNTWAGDILSSLSYLAAEVIGQSA